MINVFPMALAGWVYQSLENARKFSFSSGGNVAEKTVEVKAGKFLVAAGGAGQISSGTPFCRINAAFHLATERRIYAAAKNSSCARPQVAGNPLLERAFRKVSEQWRGRLVRTPRPRLEFGHVRIRDGIDLPYFVGNFVGNFVGMKAVPEG
jgi:hypothetical protein